MVSAASEWIMAVAQLLFFVTFVREFKQYSISAPEVICYEYSVIKAHANKNHIYSNCCALSHTGTPAFGMK